MINLSRVMISFFFALLLGACQTTASNTSNIVFEDGLGQHNLILTGTSANIHEGILTIQGGIWPKQKRRHVACGQLQFQVFNTEGILLTTVITNYSPCHLHYRPNTRRTGYFSVTVKDIPQQALRITVSYLKKNH